MLAIMVVGLFGKYLQCGVNSIIVFLLCFQRLIEYSFDGINLSKSAWFTLMHEPMALYRSEKIKKSALC